MFIKGLAIVTILGFCQAAEHAYSSQSIVLHHDHKGHGYHNEDHTAPAEVEVQKAVPLVEYVIESSGHEHKDEHKHEHKYEHKQEPKHEDHGHTHAFSTQHISVHQEHKGHDGHKEVYHIPHKVEVQEVVPVVEYVVESSGHKEEYKHEEEHEHKELPKYEQVEHYDHKHAFSSQHIERHDIPAHPPKGWNDHHGPAKYEFEYKIHDPHTHDNKYQHEARDGHHVKGVYSLHEADGSVRTVHYTADKKAGFQADVSHTTKHKDAHHNQHH